MDNNLTGTHKERTQKVSVRREKLSSFLYDMAKIIFSATVVLSITAIVEGKFSFIHAFVTVVGLLITIVLAVFANRILIY